MAPTDLGRFDSMVMPVELEAFEALRSRAGVLWEGGAKRPLGGVPYLGHASDWFVLSNQCGLLLCGQPGRTHHPRDTSSHLCLVSVSQGSGNDTLEPFVPAHMGLLASELCPLMQPELLHPHLFTQTYTLIHVFMLIYTY